MQIWNEQQPCILFEISDLETNGSQSTANKELSAGSRIVRKSLATRADTWEQAVDKGKRYLNMLKCGSGRPSEFTSFDDLDKWGWTTDYDEHLDTRPETSFMNALEYLGASYSAEDVYQIGVGHTVGKTIDGVTYPPTEGTYANKYAPALIVAENNGGPRYSAPHLGVYPRLEKLSDVMFLEYQHVMQVTNHPMTGLKGILRDHVVNPETQETVAKALGMSSFVARNVPNWPGVDFEHDSDEAAAICASPNGRAAVWLLGTHKEQLGHKTISKVRLKPDTRTVYGFAAQLLVIDEEPTNASSIGASQ